MSQERRPDEQGCQQQKFHVRSERHKSLCHFTETSVVTEEDTPELIIERKWAHELLRTVLRQLETFYSDRNKLPPFQAHSPTILGGGSLRGVEPVKIASTLGMTPGALRVAMKRLLDDYREILRMEVAQTVADASEVNDELANLLRVFRR